MMMTCEVGKGGQKTLWPALVALCGKTTSLYVTMAIAIHHIFDVQFIGKVCLFYEKGLFKKLFTHGCHDTAQGQ